MKYGNVFYLYASKPGVPRKLVASFDSEEQLRAYVRWATLSDSGGEFKFEQGSALAGYTDWGFSDEPLTDDDTTAIDHNPSPSML
jgi:hypothetical protein